MTTISEKSPDESRVQMTELVLPQHTNPLGNIFGGVVLSWIDIAAGICALRHAETPVVTAAFDAMHFLAPIKLGWVVNIEARINHVAHSSMEIEVVTTAENPTSAFKNHTATAWVTMVAIDKSGKKLEIPRLKLSSDAAKQRFADAELRRKDRLALRAKFQAEYGSA